MILSLSWFLPCNRCLQVNVSRSCFRKKGWPSLEDNGCYERSDLTPFGGRRDQFFVAFKLSVWVLQIGCDLPLGPVFCDTQSLQIGRAHVGIRRPFRSWNSNVRLSFTHLQTLEGRRHVRHDRPEVWLRLQAHRGDCSKLGEVLLWVEALQPRIHHLCQLLLVV
jgi:hypothetical protein